MGPILLGQAIKFHHWAEETRLQKLIQLFIPASAEAYWGGGKE